LAATLWLLSLGGWMLSVGGHALPPLASRTVIVAALLASLTWLVVRLRSASWVLPALLVLSFTVRFAGLSHEVNGRYYLDEGTYYHHATEIDAGRWLRPSFVYPHFLYDADAFALWIAGLFPGVTARWAALAGAADPLAASWLVLRSVVAVLSALTVVPVFRIARRLGGPWAGTSAALLLVFSPLFNEGSHLNTCDVPSAAFATWCLWFVVRLIDEERTADYLLAGVAAGLAAGSKYPAGLVAVAIVAVWVRWRIDRRDIGWGLLWAGLAAMATFVAVMPSLLVLPDLALFGGRGMLFGARQYGEGGWLGVTPRSNASFYGSHLLASFGLPAILAGLSALLLTRRGDRHRPWWLLPYPAAYLALICSMSMVVRRNLYPVIPILAVFFGTGIALWLSWVGERIERTVWRRSAAAALLLLCLMVPLADTTAQAVSLIRPSTREAAAEWILAHLPAGSSIAKESYTPDLPAGAYRVVHARFVTRLSLDELRRFDYVLVADAAYLRFADPAALLRPHQRAMAERYQQIFARFELVQEWQPSDWQSGPVLRLYRPR
jgi:dolichyl-phosphate-mannose-protein mannosyltransferase